MNKTIFLLPGLIIGLLSFKNVDVKNVTSYKKIDNITREYYVDSPVSQVVVSDFSIYASNLLKREAPRMYVEKMPYSPPVWFDFYFYDQEGNTVTSNQYYRASKEMQRGYVKIYFDYGKLYGLLHAKFTITCPLCGIYASCFAEFDMYFPGKPLDEEINNREFYCPVSADISQKKAKTVVKGEYYKFTNLKTTIEVDNYGTFYFNDLKLNFYREYYNNDISFKGRVALEHDYDLFLNGNKELKTNRLYFQLTRINDDKTNCQFELQTTFYVNPNTNLVSTGKGNNTIETHDIYFPLGGFEEFNETTFYLFLDEWGYSQFTCTIPFTVKFLKDNSRKTYEIIGEIDEKVEDGEMEEINL